MDCPQRSAEYRETALGGQFVEPLLHHAAYMRVDLIDVGMLTELCDDVDRCEHLGDDAGNGAHGALHLGRYRAQGLPSVV